MENRGIEVKMLKSFLIIRETLERIGIRNNDERKIWPSCYIYVHKESKKAYIAHFKELLRTPKMTEIDERRRNTILWLLEKWNLIKIENILIANDIYINIQEKKLDILSKNQVEVDNWEICHKIHNNTLHYHSNKISIEEGVE